MALFFPPSISIDRFQGGYKPNKNYTALEQTETNDAQNTVYTINGKLESRNGSLKLNPLSLKGSTGTTASDSRVVTGHYFFSKLGITSTFHVVAAGDSIYNYNSSTAVEIKTGLTDNTQTFFSFVQVQDPRSASDDIVIFTNGVDSPLFWEGGTASAAFLSSITSATNVPIGKYILEKNRKIYIANITDTADVDSPVKVSVSSFGSDGNPDPHRFRDSFYVGGSDRDGGITGQRELLDSIIYYRRNSIWKFQPGSGTELNTQGLIQIKKGIGCLAPFSLVNVGQFHIFLSERGVYAFDGLNEKHLSADVDSDLLQNSNKSILHLAKATLNREKNQYILYFPSSSSSRNDRALIFDLNLGHWQPLVTGRQVSYISNFDSSDNVDQVIYGDYFGYLYHDSRELNDGLVTGYNGTVSSATLSTLTDASAMFSTASEGLRGFAVRIRSGTGENQERRILSNTSSTLTVDADWKIIPDTTSEYTVSGINAYWKSRDDWYGHQDLLKLFRNLTIRTREEGGFFLTVHYIIDFKPIAIATKKLISLFTGGFVWGTSLWGLGRWGRSSTIKKTISLRNTNSQGNKGTHLAVRFESNMANQSFKISGIDVELKAIGKVPNRPEV